MFLIMLFPFVEDSMVMPHAPFVKGACFGCGQQGHMVRDCPQRRQNMSLQQRQTTAPTGVQPRANNGDRPPA